MSVLHQLIEKKKWDKIYSCLSDDPENYHQMCRLSYKNDLPLHMACERRAPQELIHLLLQIYEDAASCKGRDDNLPLHIAMQKSLSPNIIESLIRVYPYGLDVNNVSGYCPRDYGHKDTAAYQALGRPTYCWKQLINDETKEECQDENLQELHDLVDQGLNDLDNSIENIEKIFSRLNVAYETLQEYDTKRGDNLEEIVNNNEANLATDIENIENRLCSLEDEAKASSVKDFIAKAAAQVDRKKVMQAQDSSVKQIKALADEIATLSNDMELNNLCTDDNFSYCTLPMIVEQTELLLKEPDLENI